MAKKPARVPELHRQHSWVVVGQFQIGMSEFEARKAVESPQDFAMGWREQAQLVGAHGPGCQDCGIHASQGLGKPCEGPARLRRLMEAGHKNAEAAAGPSIALPGRDF